VGDKRVDSGILADVNNLQPADFPRRIAVIGLGLLGGSVALAARRFAAAHQLSLHISAYARRGTTRQLAVDSVMADEATDQIKVAVRDCDLAVIATPVDSIGKMVIEVGEMNSDTSITDVGSTKSGIVRFVRRQEHVASRFLAAHPIAGGEKSGAEFAREDLFDGKPVVLTPSGIELADHVLRIENFWQSLGGTLISMSPEKHDSELARTSHLPHLLAALAARGVTPATLPMVGSGWMDTTRVAAGNPDMWTAIVAENRDAILEAMIAASGDWQLLIDAVRQSKDEDVTRWLVEAAEIRQSADDVAGR
jgi:prephenate dehydrogenase/cyclohexadieny/prephenate dehydrogenase